MCVGRGIRTPNLHLEGFPRVGVEPLESPRGCEILVYGMLVPCTRREATPLGRRSLYSELEDYLLSGDPFGWAILSQRSKTCTTCLMPSPCKQQFFFFANLRGGKTVVTNRKIIVASPPPPASPAPLNPTPLNMNPQMAMAVRLLGVVSGGNWSEFHRILGRITAVDGGELLVGDEEAESPFAIRLRCLCHWMLLPMRAHALRALNKSYGKGEIVPLVRGGVCKHHCFLREE